MRNTKVMVKSFLPLLLMAALSAGLIFSANANPNDLSRQTRDIVDLQVVRLEKILDVRINVNEAAVNARNLILETREQEMGSYRARYDAAAKEAFDATKALIALADTPERKNTNQALQGYPGGVLRRHGQVQQPRPQERQ